ncbi:MAG: 2-oxoacid:ferredoxin oxidoreductase subunit beta [Elusimicrobia bacterium]|nr:2-oxoacid:ferredoxin oxidoreductase subunit beta [Elusimicrobiota bacterium]
MAEIKIPVKSGIVNRLGLGIDAYKGAVSTLCQGCGHDTISRHIMTAFYEYGIEPHRVAKMSGIGCSSKTPAYFMARSCGLNAVHGRMPSVATGAKLANKDLLVLGVSGDGDTAAIGIGQFMHLMRRNVDMIYIIENNGVYGLTKGQFSATSDPGSKQKWGAVNQYDSIDCCAVAIELGCSFVARSFSGDHKQMVPLIKAAIAHKGTVLLDIISPCVTFNNHEGSTKSYHHVQEHDEPLHAIDFIPYYDEVQVDYPAGTTKKVDLADGSHLLLKKLDQDYDPTDKIRAIETLAKSKQEGALLTGILYLNPKKTLHEVEEITNEPLYKLTEKELRPPKEAFAEIQERFGWGA